MSGRAALVLALVAGGVGFLAGRTTSDSARRTQRTETRASPELVTARRELRNTRAEFRRVMERKIADQKALEQRLAQYETDPEQPTAENSPPGTRLPDGTIVGGAKWNGTFDRLSKGFLDSMLRRFLQEADLSPEQERRVRALITQEAGRFLQVNANFTNGDIDGEATYEQLEALGSELRTKVAELLNDEQRANFGNLQSNIRDIMRNQIVHNEMATLKSNLGLDTDQRRKVLAIIEQRYTRVAEGIEIPIPNVFFKPLRRGRDAPIYKQTGDAIRAILSPGQRAKFDLHEAGSTQAIFDYRSQLVPK